MSGSSLSNSDTDLIFDSGNEGIAIVENGTIRLCNNRFKSMIGESESNILGTNLDRFLVSFDFCDTKDIGTIQNYNDNQIKVFKLVSNYSSISAPFFYGKIFNSSWKSSQAKQLFLVEAKPPEVFHNFSRSAKYNYSSLLELMSDGVLIVDKDLTCILANAAVKYLLEKPGTVFEGHNFAEIASGIDPIIIKSISSVLINKSPSSLKVSIQGTNSTIKHLGIKIYPVPEGALIFFSDISKRINVELSLAKMSDQYRSIFNNSNEGICVIQNSYFNLFNPKCCNIFGFSSNELANKSIDDLIHPDDLKTVKDIHKNIIAQNISDTLFRSRAVNKAGKTIWIQANCVLIQWSGGHAILSLLSDITSLVEAEAEVSNQKEMLTQILDAAPIGICLLGDDKLTWGNTALKKMFRVSNAEEYIGKRTDNFFQSEPEYKAVSANIRNLLSSGFSQTSYDIPMKRIDGSIFDAHMHIANIDLSNYPSQVIVTIEDVSDQNRTLQALTESEEKYALVIKGANDGIWDWDMLAHSINTSPRFKEILGYRPDEITINEEFWVNSLHPDDKDYFQICFGILRCQKES